jgi:hypothetical protein
MMIPTTTNVQNQAGDRSIQPHRHSSVNAGGTRLRRRLSKSFQNDSPESGFFAWPFPKPGTRGNNHPSSCQSPRIHR